MKNLFPYILCVLLIASCKDEAKSTETVIGANGIEKTAKQNDGLTTMSGEFIYYADAAVLQVGSSVYGVIIDDKMHELYTKGEAYRTESTDGIMVQIRGKIIPKAEDVEGWPFNIEIKEILKVEKLSKNEVIKIGS